MGDNLYAQQALAKRILLCCRRTLLTRYPAIGSVLASLPDVPWERERLATDGCFLYARPQSVIRLFAEAPEKLQHHYLHMLLHCLYMQTTPPTGADRALWDLACDLFVERLLRSEQDGAPDWTEEMRRFSDVLGSQKDAPQVIMKQLAMQPRMLCSVMARQFARDDHGLWGRYAERTEMPWEQSGTKSGGELTEEQAGTQVAMQHSSPRIYKKTHVAYRNYLRKFAEPGEEIETDEESFDYIYYTLGLKNYGSLPLIEPLEYREVWRLRELVIALDTSGSCSEDVVARFLSELCALLTQREDFFREMNVLILQCDAQIQDVAMIHSVTEWERYVAQLEIRGRGSTDFCPVFEEIEKMRRQRIIRKPCVLLYYTDGDGAYPLKTPDYETAFLIAGDSARPELVPRWAKRFIL